MKASDLRRDAYTWSGIADNASERAEELTRRSDVPHLFFAGTRFHDAARALEVAIGHMNRAADELEARE